MTRPAAQLDKLSEYLRRLAVSALKKYIDHGELTSNDTNQYVEKAFVIGFAEGYCECLDKQNKQIGVKQ